MSYKQFLSDLQVYELTYIKYSLLLYFMYMRAFSFNMSHKSVLSARNMREKFTENVNFSSLFSDIYFISASSSLFSAARTSGLGIFMPVITNLSPIEGL